VGLYLERSVELVVGVVGVLATGGAYVPLDPSYPRERVALVMADAGVRWVLASAAAVVGELPLASPACRWVWIEEAAAGGEEIEAVLPAGSSPAYVIYTSGSTGRPKGVVVPHGAVVRLFDATSGWFGFGPEDVWTLFHSYAFDFSVWELWGALLYGGRLVVVPYWVSRDAESLHALLLREGVTVLNQTPSAFGPLLSVEESAGSGLPSLRWVIFGGEALELSSLRPWWRRGLPGALVNMYGITETTVHVTYRRLGAGDADLGSRVGAPLPDLRVYVVGPEGSLCPAGVGGELWVGGAGVAQGYLGLADLTAARFVPDGWSGEPGARLYRSGDRGRWTAAGDLEYLGRLDEQVKIRGFRIEPGEIEAALRRDPGVGEVAVVAREDGAGGRQLVAYVVPAAETGEESWSAGQVERWREVFEETYGSGETPEEGTFNLVGWRSAATDEAIPAVEMAEWLEETVRPLRARRLRWVLEIGCGTGLVLFRLAPGCERYVGTDFSSSSLAYVGEQSVRLGLSGVELWQRGADDFSGIAPGSFDAVVLNSVAQYFPDVEYLERVLLGGLAALAPGGVMLVGDVRSLPLLRAQQLGVELERLPPSSSVAQLEQRASQGAAQETELVVSPELFVALAGRLGARAEIAPKRGRWHNELTRYRYQVLLHKEEGSEPEPESEPRWLDWRAEGLSLSSLERLLAESRPELLLVRGIGNARLRREAAVVRLLGGAERPATVGELLARLPSAEERGVEPAELEELGARLGYRVALGWSAPGEEGRFEAGFRRRELSGEWSLPQPKVAERPLLTWANRPRRGLFLRRLVPSLRRQLEESLPSHMVPSSFVMLESLPVTPQGKLDRRALPAPERERSGLSEGYVAARTPVEEALARIWSEVLGVGSVGAEDDFFHLGGHSLLATQVISQVRETLGVELPLRSLFETPRLSGVARSVEELLARRQSPAAPPIRQASRQGASPLSFAQERLWFLDRLLPGTSAYNESLSLRLEGALDAAALERALVEIVRRHESLRTRFAEVDGRPVQVVAPSGLSGLPRVDLSALAPEAGEAALARLRGEQARQGFDLQRGPLVRLALVRLGAASHALLATLHHIVFDGWSTGVLVRELTALYGAFAAGRPSPLPEPRLQYADFAAWQRAWLAGEELERQLAFWRQQLANAAALELPADRPRPAVQRFRGGKLGVRLPAALAADLRRLAQASSATLYMVLLAGFQALLGRLSGQTDVVVGSPVASRDRAETEGMIGFFVNMLVLRGDLSGDPEFATHLGRVRATALAAFAHQALPFEKLVDELQPDRDLARNPLFQVAFQVVNTPGDPPRLPGLELRLAGGGAGAEGAAAKFDLDVAFWESAGGLGGSIAYDRDRFDPASVQRLAAQLIRLLAAAVADPGARLSALPLLGDAERFQLLGEWNDSDLDFARAPLLHELFEARAEESPAATAVLCGVERLGYGELEVAANRLAHHLRGLGVGPEVRVALCVERTPAMLVALLGVLKAGGAYVPLDPSHPRERLAHILADSAARVLLTESAFLDLLPAGDHAVVCLDRDGERIAAASPRRPAPAAPPAALAYAIYTSGSTGAPKGVGVPHAAIVAFLAAMRRRPGLRRGEGVLAVTTLAFDIAALELFLSLAVGATVHLLPRSVATDGARLADAITASGATLMQATPSTWRLLRDAGWGGAPGLRVLSGGEALPRDLADFLAAGCAEAWNLYGPTETTVWSTVARLAPGGEPVPLGEPIANTRVYLLDAAGEPVPWLAPGALFIGGEGVARGYLGRPELTAERFVPDPFGGRPGGRLYATGDLARRRSDGGLEFLGRLDHQLKVRGYRVEIGEIEAALRQHPAVAEAVVVARGAGIDARLTGYAVPRSGSAPGPDELRGFLRARLPEPMVPSRLELLAALPLTPNGKLDRRALTDREPAPAAAPAAPRTAYEEALAAIWEELLAVPAGPQDRFFDLGGSSLTATRMLSRVRALFGVELPLRTVFETPTLAEIAAAIALRRGGIAVLPPIAPLPAGVAAPLSFSQERLWFLDRLVPGNPFYNMPAAVRIRGPLDAAALAASLDALRARQAALRASFPDVEGRPVLRTAAAAPEPLPVVDLAGLPEAAREPAALHLAAEEARRPFALAHGPVLRAGLLRLGSDHHVLMLTLHHIVSDGWSVGILIRELTSLYEAAAAGTPPALPSLPVQYADYAAWQRGWMAGDLLAGELAFWRQRLGGELPVLRLPLDRPRAAVQSFRGGSSPLALDRAALDVLKRLARQEGATLYMVLLAAFQTVLRRLTGQEDLIVGSPVANRRLPEVEGLIGFFVNTLALRGDLAGDPTFAELVARVREEALGAYAHQDVPFEKLVEELQPERDTSQNPIFQVLFVLQNAPLGALEIGGLSLALLATGAATTRFDLTLELQEGERGLVGSLQYDRDLLDPATVARLGEHLQSLVAALAAGASGRLSELPLLGAAALHQMRVEWNDTRCEPPVEAALHRAFEAQVRRTPEAVAVELGHEQLSYRELNRRSNHLARRLRALGVGAEVRVGICLERSLEMVVAILGVLKAGGAYVPLDPEYPRERLRYMLAAAAAPVLITGEEAAAATGDAGGERLVLAPGWGIDEPGDPGDPEVAPPLDAACYVIFTSGTTGRPKGIVVSHRALANHMQWLQRRFPLTAADAVLQKTPFSFDASVWELHAPLAVGGRLVVARPGGHRDPAYLVAALERHAVSVLQVVPTQLQMLLAEPGFGRDPRLRRVFCGGEALTPALVQRFLSRCRPGSELVNLYGPAEASIDSSFWVCRRRDEGASTAIGRPIDNASIVLLDADLREVPLGAAGELCIGGAGLGRGYQSLPWLTAERFVPDPTSAVPGGRLYRSRDLARRRPDGSLEMLGRIDGQIKLRGFRVEPGEVESSLGEHPAVREAVVEVRGDGAERRLVAWVVAVEQGGPAEAAAAPALDAAPVEQWQKVFDETFRATAGDDAVFNIVGWNSSYNGEPIPAEEMREWVDATVARILSLAPVRLLEIGCGTGLLLFRLAASCERYVATDFSASALAYVDRLLAGREELRQRVRLEQRPADDFAGVAPGSFDVVVLNSVAQYFPSLDYLLRVIDGAVAAVRPGGRIFLGDLRSLPLLAPFHASVQLARAAADAPLAELRRLAQARMAEEKELVLDPALFHALPRRLPRIGRVEVLRKRGVHRNELTRFRYDVVLHVGPYEPGEAAPGWRDWRDWEAEGFDLARLRRLLAAGAESALALTGIPDARVAADLVAWAGLEGEGSAGELRRRQVEAAGGLDPEELWGLAGELGWEVEIGDAGPSTPGRYDAFFRRPMASGMPPLAPPRRELPEAPWESYANRPLRGVQGAPLIAELRAFLKDRLPPFMVPSSFMLLDALPLNPSGKVDRAALPDPPAVRAVAGGEYAAPQTRMERLIAALWQEVLGLGAVGANDNFFDLGGHSLLVVQVHERLKAALGRELSMIHLFKYPTVASLAAFLAEPVPAVPAIPAEEATVAESRSRGEVRRDALLQRAQAKRRPVRGAS
jgi:amino acid adenylation domain-containing protein